MATILSQHVSNLARHLGFLKNFIFSKNAVNYLEIIKKHVFTASNTNIINNGVGKKEIKANLA